MPQLTRSFSLPVSFQKNLNSSAPTRQRQRGQRGRRRRFSRLFGNHHHDDDNDDDDGIVNHFDGAVDNDIDVDRTRRDPRNVDRTIITSSSSASDAVGTPGNPTTNTSTQSTTNGMTMMTGGSTNVVFSGEANKEEVSPREGGADRATRERD